MAEEKSGIPEGVSESRAQELPREALARVRKAVLRQLVDELRREVETLDAVAMYGKANEYKKANWYIKGLIPLAQ